MKGLSVILAGVVTVSAVLAALIHLDAALPVKILLAALFFSLYLILKFITELESSVVRLTYFVRCDYIANETRRLDPKDRTPARDILASDVKEEQNFSEIDKKMKEPFLSIVNVIVTVALVGGVCAGTAIFYLLLK